MDKQTKQNTIITEYESPLSFYVKLSAIAILITLIQVSVMSLESKKEKLASDLTKKQETEKVANNSSSTNINTNNLSSDEQNFRRAMVHILKWEGDGECSDDPYDSGGRTYMGITTGVARRNGYRGDVCTMSKSQVYAIYKKDYWDILPVNLAYPEKLALFNITINGSSARCKNKNTAESMLTCQQKYYESLKVFWRFGKGWTRRNNYFINLIKQLRANGY